jgi:hypothetical protein
MKTEPVPFCSKMSRISQLIESLRMRSDVGVVNESRSWRIVIAKGGTLFCEVAVPHDVLEWHACVMSRREKKEVWTDWLDYEGYDERPREELEAEMADDILAFVDRVSARELALPLSIYEPST